MMCNIYTSILLLTLGFAVAASIPVTESKLTSDLLLAGIIVHSESSLAAGTIVISQNTTATDFGIAARQGGSGSTCTRVTGGSPLVFDVKRISAHLRNLPSTTVCEQFRANHCTRSVTADTASVSFCGPLGSVIMCNYLGWSVDQVLQRCTVGDKVQGYTKYDDAHTSHVHHS